MYDIVLLTLGAEAPPGPCGPGGCSGVGRPADGSCASGGCSPADSCAASSAEAAGSSAEAAGASAGAPRAPVLACAEALTTAGARVTMVTARSDAEIDEVLTRLDGPPRSDGLVWPDLDSKTRLVVASASDAQLRAVVRRLVRRYAPPPSHRPDDLASNRTVPDLPPIGVLPLGPAPRPAGGRSNSTDLVGQFGLPRTPADVAEAVLTGQARRLDLLRNDGGSVTLDGALIGGADESGRPLPWRGRVEVDDKVLSDGNEPVLAAAIGNAAGYATLDGVALLSAPDAADGQVEVAVAVPAVTRSRWRRPRVRLEVRRARGRAVAVTPRDGAVPYLDDGVLGELNRKRSWWVEPLAWAVYQRLVADD